MKKNHTYFGVLLLLVIAIGIVKYNGKLKDTVVVKEESVPKEINNIEDEFIESLPINSEVIAIVQDDSLKTELQAIIDRVSEVKHNYNYIKTMKSTQNGIVVGYSYNISKYGISEEAASHIFEKMILNERTKLEKYSWFNDLDDVRQDAVINLAFNLGVPGLLKFKRTISHLKEGRYVQASKALLYTSRGTKSLYYRQVKGRAKEIADQIKTGVAKEPLTVTLKRQEGFRAFPYKDTRGIWTVGYGINLERRGFDEEESLLLLAFASLKNEEILNNYI